MNKKTWSKPLVVSLSQHIVQGGANAGFPESVAACTACQLYNGELCPNAVGFIGYQHMTGYATSITMAFDFANSSYWQGVIGTSSGAFASGDCFYTNITQCPS